MSLKFRNVDASPDSPVEQWPTEAVLTALERGSLRHWRRLARAIRDDPWGPVARRVEQALKVNRPYGVAELMERAIELARTDAAEAERVGVTAEIRRCLDQSGLNAAEFAERIGTSASRLSTYLNGRVTPSATMMVRMRKVAESAEQSGHSDRSAVSSLR